MRVVLLRILTCLLLSGGGALGQYILQWDRFGVFANLDNDGRVIVTETLVAKVNGKVAMLDRRFTRSTDQEIVIRKLARLDGDEQIEIRDYDWRRGELFWPIRGDNDPEWNDKTLTYVLEYELRGALAPAWDIPAGPGTFQSHERFPHFRQRWRETFAACGEPRGRYRFDHDVLFARFSSEGPRELNYTFKYDTAWKHPQPSTELHVRVTPEVSYRVTELRDYLRPGVPPAVALWKPAVRVGSIAAFIALAFALWLIYAAAEVRRHGWHAQIRDRAWFEQSILPIPIELLARHARTRFPFFAFPYLLARWRRTGVVAVSESETRDDDGDPIPTLHLLNPSPASAPHESKLLRKLFPRGRETTLQVLEEAYPEDGFDPESALADAFEEVDEEAKDDESARPKPGSSWYGRWLARAAIAVPIAGCVLALVDVFRSDYNDPLFAEMLLVGGFVALCLLVSFSLKPSGGLGRAMVALVPIAALPPALLALHFHHTRPLRVEGSLGLALLALACVMLWLSMRHPAFEDLTEEQLLADAAKDFVRRELRSPCPQLDDAWLPQIAALGCRDDVENWRKARESEAAGAAVPECAFTGQAARLPEEDWAEALSVFSAEDRAEIEKEEGDEDGKTPPR